MPTRARRDCFGRPIPGNLRIRFRRDLLAESLWEYGEDDLAEAAFRLSEYELDQVQLLAGWHYVNDPEPNHGPKLQGGRIMARAMIEFAERMPRDTTRVRRRTRPNGQGHLAAYHAHFENEGKVLESTPAENGLDSLSSSDGA